MTKTKAKKSARKQHTGRLWSARGHNDRISGDRRGIALGGRLRKARLLGGVALDAAVARRRQLLALVVAANLGAHAVKVALRALPAQCSSGERRRLSGESRHSEKSKEQKSEAHGKADREMWAGLRGGSGSQFGLSSIESENSGRLKIRAALHSEQNCHSVWQSRTLKSSFLLLVPTTIRTQ